MTVLVLDSPELIARAAALEAAQASKTEEVQAEGSSVTEALTDAPVTGRPACSAERNDHGPRYDSHQPPGYTPQQEDSLALVI
jgi:hypothetical protein